MQYINFSAVNRLQPDFSSPSFSIKYVLYFLYLKDFRDAGVKSGKQYFFTVQKAGGAGAGIQIQSECFTFDIKAKEDLQCNAATNMKECLKVLIGQNRNLLARVGELEDTVKSLEGGGGTVTAGLLDLLDGQFTYAGCRATEEMRGQTLNTTCVQDGTPWAEFLQEASRKPNMAQHTACWCDTSKQYEPDRYCQVPRRELAKGHRFAGYWVTGPNGHPVSATKDQDCLRCVATGDTINSGKVSGQCVGVVDSCSRTRRSKCRADY